MPAKHDLRWRHTEALGGGAHGLGLDILAMAERRVRLDRDVALGAIRLELGLPETGVGFDLVDRRDDARLLDDALEMLGQEIGDADGVHQAAALQLNHRLPGIDITAERRGGPMDQVEVNGIDAQ